MSTSSQRFCENCGQELSPGTRFCENCGHAIQSTTPAAPPPPIAPSAAAAPKTPAPIATAPSKRSSVGCVVSVLLLAFIALVAAEAYVFRDQLMAMIKKPGPSATTSPKGDLAAAGDLADMLIWFDQQPWVNSMRRSMPRGVTISADAEPYDAEGWSSVEMREHHAEDSGFDPNISPMVGIFRVSKKDRTVQWMEPVSGDWQSLDAFLKFRGLVGATSTPKAEATMQVIAGDFETPPPDIPNRDPAIIVADPTNNANHVARIIGPDEMGFTLPAIVPAGTKELMVKLRLLHPIESKLIPFPDGTTPEGIRLRVRLLNELGNSAIRDAIVRPSGQWRELEFVFYELPKTVVQVSVEALWMQGPIYVDDVALQAP